MSGKKKVLLFLSAVLLLAAVAAGLVWHKRHYVMIDFRFYPNDAEVLDLRDREISVRQYKRFERMLPDTEIQWNVPLGDRVYPYDAKEVTVTRLGMEDLEVLDYLTKLKTVHAEECTDYKQLVALQERRPEVQVLYNIHFAREAYPWDSEVIVLSAVGETELALLDYLPNLKTVAVRGGGDTANMDVLRDSVHSRGLEFCVEFSGERIADTAETVEIGTVTDAELNLLQLLPALKELTVNDPEASGENLAGLLTEYPHVKFVWKKTILGKRYASGTGSTELDLSDVKVESLEQLEEDMKYFPLIKTVFLGRSSFDNETLAAFRDRVRENYKVVWTVDFGGKLPTRTDATKFYPTGSGVYYFNDKEAYNLRYCEDMIVVDLGHMAIQDVSFLAYMPKLQYLILAHTQVQYLDGIENCKELKFLELDWSCVRDVSPLLGCTALEDLNLGKTWPDITPVLKMTWLKNLYMIGGSGSAAYKASQALPDTRVVASGGATVGSGWRQLPNYYAMRDALGAEYMHG